MYSAKVKSSCAWFWFVSERFEKSNRFVRKDAVQNGKLTRFLLLKPRFFSEEFRLRT